MIARGPVSVWWALGCGWALWVSLLGQLYGHWSLLAWLTMVYCCIWPMAGWSWWLWRRARQWPQHLLLAIQQQPHPGPQIDKHWHCLWELTPQLQQPELPAEQVLTAVLGSLPFPLCLFGSNQQLRFANDAAQLCLQRPLLAGSTLSSLGFQGQPPLLQHPDLRSGWQQFSLQVQLPAQNFGLFYALDLRHPLYQQQRQSQQQLVRVLSHELRNSLTPMQSMTETLLSQPELPQTTTRQVLSRIQARSQRLLAFLDAYLQQQQLPAAHPVWFALPQLVDELSQSLQLPLDYQGEPQCYADPLLFQQLLQNLLLNAAQAQQQNGSVAVLQLRYGIDGRQQWLELRDHGCGIQNPDNLFTPFYTTKTTGQGVGLLLCQDILVRHHGSIRLSNHPDGGAVASLQWPLEHRLT